MAPHLNRHHHETWHPMVEPNPSLEPSEDRLLSHCLVFPISSPMGSQVNQLAPGRNMDVRLVSRRPEVFPIAMMVGSPSKSFEIPRYTFPVHHDLGILEDITRLNRITLLNPLVSEIVDMKDNVTIIFIESHRKRDHITE
jgi:hypothetical protein